ncbi:glycosyltransferase [Nostoc sp. 'Peltigera membranacea cyanobiont' 213]|uniref:glycosyltransferase n=1 Tax=unclassified Nostoc TaxID=2593658 RepID=UPI000B9513D0|nr:MULTISPECIES: glycosyltransferase [unclassified Nostoc]AVH65960.1 family 2 glycosyltransferase [Nostoc sp. 'Peltigera membranacea cyanobiont' N6]OYD98951.1 glycosyltransferase [Nostoc sp. 'Peltigera membranacea cyanobiont' 213]
MNNLIQVDIITLTKNSSDCILRTLNSVSIQDYKQINHIIVDGDSKDQTISIINQYNHQKKIIVFQQNGLGIANAFNVGLMKSSGNLVIFLNSGDALVNELVITKIVDSYIQQKWLWAFGETISLSRRKYLKRHIKQYNYWDKNLFLSGNPICHQSTIFSHKLIHKIGLYDEQLTLEMDYDFNIRASLIAQPHLLYFPISYYDTTGISSIKVFKHYKIHRKVRNKYFPLSPINSFKTDSLCFFKACMRFMMIPMKIFL